MKSVIKISLAALMMLLLSFNAYSQQLSVRGKVLDNANQPIVGAGVWVEGTSNGTTTDIDGNFTLTVARGTTLSISCMGYLDDKILVNDSNPITIILRSDTETLEETVVIGYGVQKKSDLTGSVASVKAEDLSNRTSTDAASALQGKAAGVQIVNSSGAPGSSSSIQIRGYSSNTRTSPLMIVDGLKVSSIDYLDPDNIASIEILKDAASAAIYGIEAGNGVILITTRSGSDLKNDGRIFYNFQTSYQEIAEMPDMMGAKDYIDYQVLSGAFTEESFNWDGKTDTHWAERMFERGHQSRHTIGFQGNNDRGSLYVSLTSTDNNGIIAGDKDIYNRLGAQINAEYKIKKWATVGVNTSLEKRTSRTVSESISANSSLLGAILLYDPTTPWTYDSNNLPDRIQGFLNQGRDLPKDADGNIYGISNVGANNLIWHPAIMRDRTDSESKGFNVRGTAYLNLTPIKGLTFTSRLGYRAGYSHSSSYNYELFVTSVANQSFSISGTASNNLYYQWENFANYLFDIGKNSFTVMAGTSFQKSTSDSVGARANQLSSYEENFRYLNNAINTSNMSVSGAPNESTNLSYFGRINWSYGRKYNAQANFRADAYDTSKLDKNHRWGFFPSFSAGWTISNEEFVKNAFSKAKIDFLKLRASWGINGNVNAVSNYQYASTLSTSMGSGYNFNNEMIAGVVPSTRLPNPELSWETSRQVDIGLDARLLNNRLTFAIDWYNKNTVDLITSSTAPAHTGTTTVNLNAGKVNNKGLELELSWKDTYGDFSYGISGNGAFLKNMVVEGVSKERVAGSDIYNAGTVTFFEEGYPLWYLATYEVDHIDQQTGAAVYVDQNGDGVINSDDQRFSGSGIPDFTYGLTLNFAYKGFDLIIYGAGVQGNEKLFALFNRGDTPEANKLQLFYDKSWKSPQSTGYKYPKPSVSDINFVKSDFVVYDASFFKIKQIQFGYSVPRNLLKKIGMSQLRAYVSLDDWFTFTDYIGLDPETNAGGSGMAIDYGAYPISKKVVFGLNVAF